MPRSNFNRLILAALLLAGLGASTAFAWTPATQVTIGENAASISPPDLTRQIARHREAFRRGLLSPFEAAPQKAHVKNPSGGGELDSSVKRATERAVAAIKTHQPFAEVVYQLGIVAHFVADASNPMNTSDEDSAESTYFNDYLRYIEAARPRFPIVFYGEGRDITNTRDLDLLFENSLVRGRGFYPMIGKEYQRIGRVDGVTLFDDRSTAFGVGSLSVSHAVSDVAAVMRYIWLQGGGGDHRQLRLTRPRSAIDSPAKSR